jgi:hypothetical protein
MMPKLCFSDRVARDESLGEQWRDAAESPPSVSSRSPGEAEHAGTLHSGLGVLVTAHTPKAHIQTHLITFDRFLTCQFKIIGLG